MTSNTLQSHSRYKQAQIPHNGINSKPVQMTDNDHDAPMVVVQARQSLSVSLTIPAHMYQNAKWINDPTDDDHTPWLSHSNHLTFATVTINNPLHEITAITTTTPTLPVHVPGEGEVLCRGLLAEAHADAVPLSRNQSDHVLTSIRGWWMSTRVQRLGN